MIDLSYDEVQRELAWVVAAICARRPDHEITITFDEVVAISPQAAVVRSADVFGRSVTYRLIGGPPREGIMQPKCATEGCEHEPQWELVLEPHGVVIAYACEHSHLASVMYATRHLAAARVVRPAPVSG